MTQVETTPEKKSDSAFSFNKQSGLSTTDRSNPLPNLEKPIPPLNLDKIDTKSEKNVK